MDIYKNSLACNALRHIVAGLAIQAPFLLFDPVAGAIAASMFFLGRERRDTEIKQRIPMRHWYRGWAIWRWSRDSLADLLPVCLVVWLVALATLAI